MHIVETDGKDGKSRERITGTADHSGSVDVTWVAEELPSRESVFCDFMAVHALSTSHKEMGIEVMRERLKGLEWVETIRKVLAVSQRVARRLKAGISVLVQSAHGDDTCAMVNSLVQIMLDPYYRTRVGLAVLIEKEWLSCGHKFISLRKPSRKAKVDL